MALDELAKIAGPAVIGSGGVAAFMRWVQGKDAQNVATQLALMRQQLDHLAASFAKHENIGERMALLEQDHTALRREVAALVSPAPRDIERRRGK